MTTNKNKLVFWAGLGICSTLIRSNCSGQMSDCERIAQVTQTNEQMWAIRSSRSEQMSESLSFLANRSFFISLTKNEWFTQKNRIFVRFFTVFFKFKKNKKSHSFLLSKVSELLGTNERLWGISSGCSEGMSDREKIAQLTNQKWVIERIPHFLSELLIFLLF